MGFPFYIARRYTISRSKSTAINIITRIAATGIVVSTAALLILLCIFGGFREFSVSFTNATDPDLKLTPAVGKFIVITPEYEQKLKNIKGLETYSKVAEERVLFYFDGKEQVAYLKGVDSLFTEVNAVDSTLVGGQWPLTQTKQVVAGAGIFNKLSLGLFDFNRELVVYVPKAGEGTINTPEDAFITEGLNVVGVYSINDEVDSKYVYCNLDLAQFLLQFPANKVTSLEMKLAKGASEADVRQQLQQVFGADKIKLRNRAELNDSLYKMLNAENLVTYLFASLVVVLTLFCLAGALIMFILDKRENLKTLYSMGAEVKEIRNIFFYPGLFITALGSFFGILLGSGIVLAQEYFSLVMITDTMAYPVSYSFMNIIIVLLTIFTLGIVASRIAASRVSKRLIANS